MCPCTSDPHKIKNLMFGLDMMFATTFSTPRFSVLHGPAIAAPAAAGISSMCDAKVTTATAPSGSPTM